MSKVPSRKRCGRLAAVALALVAILCGATAPAYGKSTPTRHSQRPRPTMTLIRQSAWVAPGGIFHIELATNQNLAKLDLSAAVYPALTSRSALSQAIQGHEGTVPLATLGAAPATGFQTTKSKLALDVAMPSATSATVPANIQLPPCSICQGVYPIRLTLAPRGKPRHPVVSLTTEILALSMASNPLRFSWVLSLPSRVAFGPHGQVEIPPGSQSAALAEANAVSSSPAGAPTLAPMGEQLYALSHSGSPAVKRQLQAWRKWAGLPGHQVLTMPFSPLNPYVAGRAGLASATAKNFALGQALETSVLQAQPTSGLWAGAGPITSGSLKWMPHGIHSLVLPASSVSTAPSVLTPDQPFVIGTPSKIALVSDHNMGSLVTSAPKDPVLVAHELLASLAQTYLEIPNSTALRAVVLSIPGGQPLPGRFLQSFQAGLASSPVVNTMNLASLFQVVASPYTELPSRYLEVQYSGPRLNATTIRSDEAKIAGVQSAFGALSPQVKSLRADLSIVSSGFSNPSVFPSSAAAQRAFLRLLAHIRGSISISGSNTVTLTSRKGSVPLTILSTSPTPIHAQLRVSSSELGFPAGSSRMVVLSHRANSVSFFVKSRGAGDFPLVVEVISPKGHLVLLQQRLTVRSTAASVVALILTATAAGVLALWWVRSTLTGPKRRNRHLLPKAPQANS